MIHKNCLSCKYFKLKEVDGGVCKIGRGKIEVADYPKKGFDDYCNNWHDCGQNYYIRKGWIQAQSEVN